MKEIQKVVQKLSREQKSVAGGGGAGGGVQNIKSPPVYRGNLITEKYILKLFAHLSADQCFNPYLFVMV